MDKPRYSDEDLQEFREIIEKKIALAKRDYEDMMESIKNPHGNDIVAIMLSSSFDCERLPSSNAL